ncbi:hypothetical protein [Companilactobacillus keshanensis]|uniref:DUF2975 domain-containing protein n=1 Tax=Companilactobacillus keshanensis TaxID=2486003 RepID=A0ABW4BUV9_9LACO|nr:hypothetical protein [Companilactobacillus keshanensis]
MDQILVIMTLIWLLITAVFLGLSLIQSVLELKYNLTSGKDGRSDLVELKENFVNVHQMAGIVVSILIMIIFSVQIGQTWNISVTQSLKMLLTTNFTSKITWMIVFSLYNLYAIVSSFYLFVQNDHLNKILKSSK